MHPALFLLVVVLVLLLGDHGSFTYGLRAKRSLFGNNRLVCYTGHSRRRNAAVINSLTHVDQIDPPSASMLQWCCANKGIWILYDHPHFNYGYPQGKSRLLVKNGGGEKACVRIEPGLSGPVSSARFVGAFEGPMTKDALTFYGSEGFNGHQLLVTEDRAFFNEDLFSKSLIVSGCSSWTVYQNTFFGGVCACVSPRSPDTCEPGLFAESASLAGFSNQILSARKGCHCRMQLQPPPPEHSVLSYEELVGTV